VEASAKRTLATNNSPAIAACASTGSGRDHKEEKKARLLDLISPSRIYGCRP
jgi:hypothetical protein